MLLVSYGSAYDGILSLILLYLVFNNNNNQLGLSNVTDVIKSYDYEPEPRHIETHIVT